MSAIGAADLDYVRELVRRESGIALEPDMAYLVESRLGSLAREEGLPSAAAVLDVLRGDDRLVARAVEAMTTNETSFFRDPAVFDSLCEEILPSLASAGEGPIRIWCAACSSGQEPYSIVMAVRERCPHLMPRLSILATDLSTAMLSKARGGRYSQLEVNRGMPAALLAKHFEKQGLQWMISPALRTRIEFRELNLVADWGALPTWDVIFLRNVLIYFDVALKSAILRRARGVLRPDGALFLGASESMLNLGAGYRRIGDRGCYYRPDPGAST